MATEVAGIEHKIILKSPTITKAEQINFAKSANNPPVGDLLTGSQVKTPFLSLPIDTDNPFVKTENLNFEAFNFTSDNFTKPQQLQDSPINQLMQLLMPFIEKITGKQGHSASQDLTNPFMSLTQ